MYDLFLDDERFPAYQSNSEIVICRNADEFREVIKNKGWPNQIHLDHDLGEGEDGSDVMKWMYGYVMDKVEEGESVPDMKFFIHSQNPIGRKSMEGYIQDIDRYLKMSKKPGFKP